MFGMERIDAAGQQTVKLPALEKNILKYRALEMTIILFHAESLKRFIIDSIRATDKLRHLFHDAPPRFTHETKKTVQKAFDILVSDGVLTQEESEEVQELIGYRNDVAHRIHLLTSDIGDPRRSQEHLRSLEVKYRYDALGKFEHYRDKIEQGMGSSYVLSLSLDTVFFENAKYTYKEELGRLRNKINRQFTERKRRIAQQQAQRATAQQGSNTE